MTIRRGDYAKKSVALFEIKLLVLATVAFAFLLSQSIVVEAAAVGPNALTPQQIAQQQQLIGVPPTTPIGSQTSAAAVEAVKKTAQDTTTASGGGIEETLGELLQGRGPKGEPGVFGAQFEGLNHLVSGLAYAGIAAGITYMVLSMAGADRSTIKAATLAVAVGAGIARFGFLQATTPGSFAGGFFNSLGFGSKVAGAAAGNSFLWGIGISIVVFALTYKSEKKKTVQLLCLPWEAPLGGADCEKCNGDPLKPCSEYRCKSLGQACDLVNKGTSEERCVWVSRNDVKSPVIGVWNEVLTQGYAYNPNNAVRPPNRGFIIVNRARTDGCIKPFTPLEFGIKLDEPAQCKIDTESGNKTFDEMQYYFGESNFYRYNHTEQLRLPSPNAINAESPEIPTEGHYNFYVRCRDANGNTNEDVFAINFCVDKSPDTTPPLIESTSILSGSPVQFGAQSAPVTLNINEPAECRWSNQDKDYSLMENNMSCSNHVYEQNAQQLYPCTTTLNGLQDRVSNSFFFRCKDQPLANESQRNVNRESYKLVLRGSQTLTILNAGPNATLTGSTDSVSVNLTVTTDDGSDEGQAVCSFSSTGREGSFVSMFETNSYQHKQILNLGTGSYTYYFRCVDAGGNAAQASTSFSVQTDRSSPFVTRVYKESDVLKLVTNEDAECRYSLNSCNFVFTEGLLLRHMNANDRKSHILEWKPNQIHYIKCRDDFGNEPQPNACSVVVSPLLIN